MIILESTSVPNNEDVFTCDFVLNTKPEITLTEYRDFSLPKPSAGIGVSEFAESILQDLRERNGDTVPFGDDDFISNGDSAIIDYTGTIDCLVRPELTVKKEVITIGSSPFPQFDENLLGMKLGDVRQFDIVAPEKAAKEYIGKTISFNVSLAMGSKKNPAPLDDELAKRMSFENLEALRTHVNTVAAARVDKHEKAALAQQVAARLVEKHEFKIPTWITTAEAQMNAKRAKLTWDELTDERKEEIIATADKSVRLSLVLEKIRDKEAEAQLSDEELEFHLQQELVKISKATSQEDVDRMLQQLTQSGMLPILVGKIRDEYTLSFLVKTCTVVE